MFFRNTTSKLSEERKVAEKLQKRDKILEELGCYVNLNVVENYTLFSIERIHLLSKDGDITEVNFLNENGQLQRYELYISRKDHKQIVDKLNNHNRGCDSYDSGSSSGSISDSSPSSSYLCGRCRRLR